MSRMKRSEGGVVIAADTRHTGDVPGDTVLGAVRYRVDTALDCSSVWDSVSAR